MLFCWQIKFPNGWRQQERFKLTGTYAVWESESLEKANRTFCLFECANDRSLSFFCGFDINVWSHSLLLV